MTEDIMYKYDTLEEMEKDCSLHLKQIGDTIKNIRKKRKMTQKQLSQYAGISIGIVVQIERGKYPNVTFRQLRKISYALGVPLSDISYSDFFPLQMYEINRFFKYYPYIEKWRLYKLIEQGVNIYDQSSLSDLKSQLETIYNSVPEKIRTLLELDLGTLSSHEAINSLFNDKAILMTKLYLILYYILRIYNIRSVRGNILIRG